MENTLDPIPFDATMVVAEMAQVLRISIPRMHAIIRELQLDSRFATKEEEMRLYAAGRVKCLLHPRPPGQRIVLVAKSAIPRAQARRGRGGWRPRDRQQQKQKAS